MKNKTEYNISMLKHQKL